MSFTRRWPRTGHLPSIQFLIPVLLMLLIISALVHAHLRFQASIGPPPARLFFEGLPVTGSLRDARSKGFTRCLDFVTTLRCRRANVMLMGHGPFEAAVDLLGGDGRGGFYQLTLWHDRDKYMASDFARDMERQGWRSCLTMRNNWGDQNILRRKGSPVRISVDLSYYAKRRIRIMAERFSTEPHCE